LTNTVSIVADHLGNTRPFVNGHLYVSIGDVSVSNYRAGTTTSDPSGYDAATDETITRDDVGGSFITDGYAVGDYITIVGSHSNNDAHLMQIKTLTATVLTTEADTALTADTGGGDEVITHAGEKILASSFGLKSITSVELLSQENLRQRYVLSKPRDNGTFFYLYAFNTNADNNSTLLAASLVGGGDVAGGTTVLGEMRLKVTGTV